MDVGWVFFPLKFHSVSSTWLFHLNSKQKQSPEVKQTDYHSDRKNLGLLGHLYRVWIHLSGSYHHNQRAVCSDLKFSAQP